MAPSADVKLTDEQQVIVAHDLGPAVVQAVAGAGKTTSIVHRIERLVCEDIVPAAAVLVTAFNKQTADELKQALLQWPHCARVQVRTLHAVGYSIIRRAAKRGLLNNVDLDTADKDSLDQTLFYQTLQEARRAQVEYVDELETIDQEDFLTYIGISKGNLLYANLRAAQLPPEAARYAKEATAPRLKEWYLDLYRRYEVNRRRRGAITFDDMIMVAWELLLRSPRLRQEICSQYQMVLVDEFQDVNIAQYRLLDVLTEGHRNYMVIGDPAQAIYGWRGSDPRLMQEFARTYRAVRYVISDNFRCRASQVGLANAVIRANKVGLDTRLSLTQGFGGATQMHLHDEGAAMGQAIVEYIAEYLQGGRKPAEIAVLVRIYAQTPYIEQALVARRIPYRVTGSQPFYLRREVATLLGYARLARWERDIANGQTLSDEEVGAWSAVWSGCYNRPSRYIPRALADKIRDMVTLKGASLRRALRVATADATYSTVDRIEALIDLLDWLSTQLDMPAEAALQKLESKLKYCDYLATSSGFPETGEAKIANVTAAIAYARDKGTLEAFLDHLAELAALQSASGHGRQEAAIELTTIHRAKGREWPVVFVPDCNDGYIPFGELIQIEEERRLFYVALTRAREFLHLHALKKKALSPFLDEAKYQSVLDTCNLMGAALALEPLHWTRRQLRAMVTHEQGLGVERYFTHWWGADESVKMRTIKVMRQLFVAVAEADLAATLGIDLGRGALWNSLSVPADDKPPLPYAFEEWVQECRTEAKRKRQRATPPPGYVGPVSGLQRGDRVQHPTSKLKGTVKSVEWVRGVEEAIITVDGGGDVRYRLDMAKLDLIERHSSS